MRDVVLKETAMVRVGNARVGCGNLWDREYLLPDGSTATGMSARLAMGGAALVVGVGSELAIDGVCYRVVAIDKQPSTPGRVHLRQIE